MSSGHSANRSFVVSRQNSSGVVLPRAKSLQGGGELSMRAILTLSRLVSGLIERLVSPTLRQTQASVSSTTPERDLTFWSVARQRPQTNREFAEAAIRVFRTLR